MSVMTKPFESGRPSAGSPSVSDLPADAPPSVADPLSRAIRAVARSEREAATMNGLSLDEPYASLITCGAKRVETRSWSTSFRGLVAIHAKKTLRGFDPAKARALLVRFPDVVPASITTPACGQVLCVAQLVDCVPTDELRERITPLELACGLSYEGDRFGFVLEDVRLLRRPVRMRGWMKLWTPDEQQRAAIEAELPVSGSSATSASERSLSSTEPPSWCRT